MQLITVKLSEIKPYDNNPRKNDGAVSAVKKSIEQCEYIAPIILDEDNVILAGHTRYKALKELGYTEVECVIKSGLTAEQKRKYRLLDNKTAEIADWDFDMLKSELADLDFGDLELDWDLPIEEEVSAEITEDDVPEIDEESEPICKLGDIWQLGNHRLICGDSTQSEVIDRLLVEEKGKIDCVVTDPPYNVAYKGKTKNGLTIQNDEMDRAEYEAFLTQAFKNMREALKDGGGFYVWHASRTQREVENALNAEKLTVRQQLIWAKSQMTLGRQDYQWRHEPCFYGWKDGSAHYFTDDRTQTTVLEFKKPTKNEEHPTMKPVALIAKLIENSTRKGDKVLDIFGGSGTTLIACEQTDRVCFTAEIDPKYCDVIITRWENLTGGKAVKIST